jgi:hypothetical protein
MIWNRESIENLIQTNNKAVEKAIIHIFNRQTSDEQSSEDTKYHNNKGFTPADAEIFSSFAKFYYRTGFLTPKQIAYARRPGKNGISKIGKYWRQLLEEIERKSNSKEVK